MKSYAPAVIPGRRAERLNLWDQTAQGSERPFGFEEINYKDITKGKGGSKNSSKKIDEENLRLIEEMYVQGPLDNDPPEINDADDVNGYSIAYGPEAFEAYGIIDDFLVNLEECDEPLLDIIKQCYGLLTGAGQMRIATEGIR